jgi:hypothetical protein
MNRFRRLAIRYERRADLHEGFLQLVLHPHRLELHPSEAVLLNALIRLLKLGRYGSQNWDSLGIGVRCPMAQERSSELPSEI